MRELMLRLQTLLGPYSGVMLSLGAPIAVLRRFTASDLALDVLPGATAPDPGALRAAWW